MAAHGIVPEVWSEVGRHIEIAESISRLAELIQRAIPLSALLIRQVDPPRRVLETIASWDQLSRLGLNARTEEALDDLDQLMAWCRQRHIAVRPAAAKDNLFGLVLPQLSEDVTAIPLFVEEGYAGFALLATTTPLSDEQQEILKKLVDPLTVAFENDRRLRELVTLREAVEADNRFLRAKLGQSDANEIVGAGQGLKSVMDRIRLVAPSDVPVLILGETGSGKEVIARALHQGSPRAGAPFLRVNCGAIPSELIDSELFGHERGSFTGAANLRKGWFERADGGTLFLDEVGELPPAAQVRLLRVLQDSTFERVGGEKSITADVRVVAATHRDLQAMVQDGTFREDLWYRLAIYPVRLPPLRDRPEDVGELATHFALRAAQRFGLPPLIPTPEDVTHLLAYPWPGNVRELRAVIERAAILGNGKRLEIITALGGSPGTLVTEDKEPASSNSPPIAGPFPTLDQVITQHIEAALTRTQGQIEGTQGAGALLGVNPQTLRGKMRKLNIQWRKFR